MTLKRILVVVIALAALGGIGLFILDRTIFAPVAVNSNLPSAPTLAAPTAIAANSSTPVAASVSTPLSSSAQLYRIDAAQSEVHYEVDETLFNENNRLNTAIGRTKGIAGEIRVDFAKPANSQIGTFVIDVSQFTSDESRRDNFIRRQGLESGRYPTATFTTRSIDGLPAQVQPGQSINFTITGDLTVKTTTKQVTWSVSLAADKDKLTGSATLNIKLSDFAAGPIQIPLLQTKDAAKLVFDIVAVAATS
jgi:polyisoprenoid-binding protein YceI